jgi:hypothetical protein
VLVELHSVEVFNKNATRVDHVKINLSIDQFKNIIIMCSKAVLCIFVDISLLKIPYAFEKIADLGASLWPGSTEDSHL